MQCYEMLVLYVEEKLRYRDGEDRGWYFNRRMASGVLLRSAIWPSSDLSEAHEPATYKEMDSKHRGTGVQVGLVNSRTIQRSRWLNGVINARCCQKVRQVLRR